MDKLCTHVNSIIRLSKGRVCSWCDIKAYQACGLCNDSDGKPVAMHVSTRGGNGKFLSLCFLNYHNDNCIGLAKDCVIKEKETGANLRKVKRTIIRLTFNT